MERKNLDILLDAIESGEFMKLLVESSIHHFDKMLESYDKNDIENLIKILPPDYQALSNLHRLGSEDWKNLHKYIYQFYPTFPNDKFDRYVEIYDKIIEILNKNIS
jgi:hypothetical protein